MSSQPCELSLAIARPSGEKVQENQSPKYEAPAELRLITSVSAGIKLIPRLTGYVPQ